MNIEQAEQAFDVAIGNGAEVADVKASQVGIESIFPTRVHEDDIQAGGDGLPNPIKARPRAEKAAQEAVEGADDIDDLDRLLYGDVPGEEGDEGEEGEEGDDPADEEDDDEEDEGEGEVLDELPAELANKKIRVLADGEELEVPLSEAVQGYQRLETFHRRLNGLTEVARNLETKATEVVAERTKAVELIDQLGNQLAEFLPTEPNWDEEFKKDSNAARKLQKNFETLKGKLTDLAKKRAEIVAKNEEDRAAALANFILTEKAKVRARNPHWSDPKKEKRDLVSMIRTLKSENFSDDEIKQLYDSRMIAIVLKASKYDRMTANRPKASQRGKAIIKPGAGRVRTAPKAVNRAQAQLSKTGRVEDAAAVFQHLLT